eukprot:SM000056S17923  [mRNA]  locus=s56:82987:85847:+ [translate_table: standard]
MWFALCYLGKYANVILCPLRITHTATARLPTGPCSPWQTAVVIRIHTVDDFAKRLTFSRNATVRLVLHADLAIAATLVLGAPYSCTILTSAPGPARTISSADPTVTVLALRGSNILVTNVNVVLHVTPRSPTCPASTVVVQTNGAVHCPAILIRGGFGIQVTQGYVYGRIDFWDAYQATVDSMVLRAPASDANVRIGAGCGNSNGLDLSGIAVTNNDIAGGTWGVLLGGSSVGATVANNHCHGLGWTCVQVGMGITQVGDAQRHYIAKNYIVVKPGDKGPTDAGGIYMAVHWYNPSNRLHCNWVVGGEHCLYIDYASSGGIVDGLVCVDTNTGVKQNNGKHNTVKGVLSIRSPGLPAWISCQNYFLNNCLAIGPGRQWYRQGIQKFKSPTILRENPWFATMCSEKSVNGVACNRHGSPISAHITGNCSGLPTGNIYQQAIVAPKAVKMPTYLGCQGLEQVEGLNRMDYKVYQSDRKGFIDAAAGDYGLLPSSPIYKDFPDFTSCPRSEVGPQRVDPESYYAAFNVQRATIPLVL